MKNYFSINNNNLRKIRFPLSSGDAMPETRVVDLLEHYERLLGFYERLESVSGSVFEGLESGTRAYEIAGRLKESAQLAENIAEESRAIAEMKESLLCGNVLGERERGLVRRMEERLAETVKRVVERESESRELISKRGVKISRR